MKSRTIFKYTLTSAPGMTQDVTLPDGARIIHVEIQRQAICFWAEVDVDAEQHVRRFQVFGTGHEIPDNAAHRGSVQMPPFMWHIYELV